MPPPSSRKQSSLTSKTQRVVSLCERNQTKLLLASSTYLPSRVHVFFKPQSALLKLGLHANFVLVTKAFRLHNRDLGMVVSAIDEGLAVFLETKMGEKDRDDHFLAQEFNEFDDSSGASPDRLTSNRVQSEKINSRADDSFLKLETERVGCDWLPMELDTSSLPLVKESVLDSVATQTKSSNGGAIFLKSEPANSPVESASLSKKLIPLATALHTANRIPLSSGGRKATPRSATPTGKTSLPAKSKSFHPSTTTLKVTKPVAAQGRSVTPARLASISSKSSTRSATPTLEPSTQAMTCSASAKDEFSPGRETDPAVSQGTSAFLKTKPSKPSVMRTSSHDTPHSSKTLMPKKVASASKGRPSLPNTISLNSNSRQKACSPSSERAPNGTHHKSESMMLTRNRSRHTTGLDDVNPVLMGSKMVERVVNMRKLAPPKQDEYSSQDYAQKSFREGSGFGRSLSKKSLDMAIRHMDIRRSIPDNIISRPSATVDLTLVGTASCSCMDSTVDARESTLATSRY
ncbi:uncharacterized protein [Primulina eburnea]|uniref:uncharacterized protein isoform X2 n=1 Tax=Primulina eburnea TaxID=1245227 RepID=UPI003C6C4FFC